jgi:uncharacterized protein YdeI (YjbR/CyaY-like superfamily)
MEPQPFPNPLKLRAWFAKHASTKPELWILFHKVHTGKSTVTYAEAVDEALSVGWIDGKVRRVDDKSYMQRFTLRRPGSSWSSVNIRKANALIAAGRMTPAGLAAFKQRDRLAAHRYSFENRPKNLPRNALSELKKDRKAWEFWEQQPPGYRRVATWYVLSAKRDETQTRRLAQVIDYSARGKRLPQLISPEPRIKPVGKNKVRIEDPQRSE